MIWGFMMLKVDAYNLRRPEPRDLDLFYLYKNDTEINSSLGGFHRGYSKADLADWLEAHRLDKNELLLTIADEQDQAIGQVGLYKIDHRIGMAEFAILIGKKELWGRGIGTKCTRRMVEFAFNSLNLRRIYLELVDTNSVAHRLYESIGFKLEGRLRKAQYKNGAYVDVLMMGLLKDEYV